MHPGDREAARLGGLAAQNDNARKQRARQPPRSFRGVQILRLARGRPSSGRPTNPRHIQSARARPGLTGARTCARDAGAHRKTARIEAVDKHGDADDRDCRRGLCLAWKRSRARVRRWLCHNILCHEGECTAPSLCVNRQRLPLFARDKSNFSFCKPLTTLPDRWQQRPRRDRPQSSIHHCAGTQKHLSQQLASGRRKRGSNHGR